RLIHAVPDAPAVAVDLGADGTFEVEDLAPFAVSEAAGIAVQAREALPVAVYTAAEPRALVAVFTVPELRDRDTALLVLTGLAEVLPREDLGVRLLAADRDRMIELVPPAPSMVLLHAVADAPPLEARLNRQSLVTDL